jgi:hypothetical protein
MLYVAYEKAVQILEGRGETIPSELWNNIGVLKHAQGLLEDAEKAYKNAIASSGIII